jgi:methylglutaconyl-CoA hydratase
VADQHLAITTRGSVEYVTLNRPGVRNALDETTIAELAEWAAACDRRPDVRAAVLAGAGSTFSAGADVAWMARTVEWSEEENLRDATSMARMFEALDQLRVPLVGRIHGAALGGGAGLTAVCDIVVAEEGALFGFTEVTLGILPAVISPFVLAKIGESAARELFLTGRRFTAQRACEIGLVHRVVPAAELDAAIGAVVTEILAAAPGAVAEAKALIREIRRRPPDETRAVTTAAIARRRVSREGQEGLRAFLDKRPPPWRREPPR